MWKKDNMVNNKALLSSLGNHIQYPVLMEKNMVCVCVCARVCAVLSRFVMSDSLQPCGLPPARFLCPWNSPGNNIGVGCHALLQGIFLTQWSNLPLLCRLHRQVGSLSPAPPGKPYIYVCMYACIYVCVCVCITESLCYTTEISTTWQISYTSTIFFKKKSLS